MLKKLRLAAAAAVLSIIFTQTSGGMTAAADNTGTGGSAAVTGQSADTGYAAVLYNAENGLPTSDANVIFAASDGFIWVGSYAGLLRYDGTNFERQDPNTGVTNVNTLFEDSRHRLWAGTNDNGIVMLDGEVSRHFTYIDGLRSSSVRAITEDANGNILVGTTQGICYIDSDLVLHDLGEPQTDNAYILRLAADSSGTVYGNSRGGDFFRIRDLRITDYYSSGDFDIGTVFTIAVDPSERGAVWLGSDNGTLSHGSFDRNFSDMEASAPEYSEPVYETDESGNVTDICDSYVRVNNTINRIGVVDGTLWVLTEHKILYRDGDGIFRALDNIPLTDSIESFTVDYEGNLWFSSSRQGIMKVVANRFANVTDAAGLPAKVVNSVCLHNGLLYAGTDSGLQVTDMNDRSVDTEIAGFMGEARIRCITEDTEGNLWLSTYTGDMGLVCLTAEGEIVQYTEADGLANNKCRCTNIAPDGAVLAATNGGVTVIRDGRIERSITAASGLTNTVVLTVDADDSGKYYLGTDGDGVYISDGSNLSRIGRADGLSSEIILRIKYDRSRGIVWIITSNSIQYLKDGAIGTVQNFPYSNNYDIYFADDGNAWLLASNGIYVANADEMLGGERYDCVYYGISDGLPSIPTGNSFSCLADNGDLYISGRGNVTRVNTDRSSDTAHDLMFSIPYIEANDERYYPDENGNFRIPSDADNITVYAYALTYSMHDPEIMYLLQGSDGKGVIVNKSDMQPLRYTNLAGGEHEFSLSLLDSTSRRPRQTFTATIIKAKKFYEELWFYFLIGAAIIFVLSNAVKLYIDRKTRLYKKKEEEQKILIRDIAEAFAKTIDMKDKYTNGHSNRVAKYTAMLTRELGYDENTVEKYYNIALLHDIGKIGVPMEVLNKPGKLTDEEYAIIKSHTTLGYDVLKNISIMPEIAIGAGSHHERPDGKGYPKGLKGDDIPRVAQIIAVADTFDAMYSTRPYRKRMNFDKVVSIITEVSGTQLTPDVVDAFLRLVENGEFRDPDDNGGGSTEDIVNIREHFKQQESSDEVKVYTPHGEQ